MRSVIVCQYPRAIFVFAITPPTAESARALRFKCFKFIQLNASMLTKMLRSHAVF